MDDRKKQDKSRRVYDKRHRDKKERKMSPNSKRCVCGNEMCCRGASDTMGGISWKCRNKKCGRTIWERKPAAVPESVIPQSYLNRIR